MEYNQAANADSSCSINSRSREISSMKMYKKMFSFFVLALIVGSSVEVFAKQPTTIDDILRLRTPIAAQVLPDVVRYMYSELAEDYGYEFTESMKAVYGSQGLERILDRPAARSVAAEDAKSILEAFNIVFTNWDADKTKKLVVDQRAALEKNRDAANKLSELMLMIPKKNIADYELARSISLYHGREIIAGDDERIIENYTRYGEIMFNILNGVLSGQSEELSAEQVLLDAQKAYFEWSINSNSFTDEQFQVLLDGFKAHCTREPSTFCSKAFEGVPAE